MGTCMFWYRYMYVLTITLIQQAWMQFVQTQYSVLLAIDELFVFLIFLGNVYAWHGSIDILMGSNSVALKVAGEPEDSTEGDTLSFEVKDSQDLTSFFSQIISQAIVFAFVQKKYNPEYEIFLTPTIAISRNDVLFYFYDPENDILLESAPFSLFVSYRNELAYVTILALWLAINHKYFCTGVTNSMKKRDFTTDFLKKMSNDTQKLYTSQVSFGGCRYGPKRGVYFLPQKGHGWIIDD